MRPSEDTEASGKLTFQSPRETTSKLSGAPPSALRRTPSPWKDWGGVAVCTCTWRDTRMRRHAALNTPAACAPASGATAITDRRPIGARRTSLAAMSAPASGARAWRQDLNASAASGSEASSVCSASSAALSLARSAGLAITTSPVTAGAPSTSSAPISAAEASLCRSLPATAANTGACARPAGICRARVSISSPTAGKALTSTRLPARCIATPMRQALS